MADNAHPTSALRPDEVPFAMIGTLAERMGMELLEADVQRTVARMPVAGNTQPYGLLHGGASAALAETVGSIGAALHAGADRIAVGVDLNATHHRAVRDGHVTAVATPLSLGRSVAAYEIVVTDDEGRRVCTARLTCALRERPPGA
ncbi:hotdog fold thioesterase [Ornithinimicrobium sufpigmenti]|uniref:hotdog fold thioesterase n=1 Tax=Ornithinimicrobium sufpigmenti TaxID=2508882 RepID=UPI001035C718